MSRSHFNLTDDEMLLLKALAESPVFQILKKVVEQDVAQTKGLLVNEDDPKTFYRLQGRVVGAQIIEAIPNLCRHLYVQRQAKEKSKPKK